ncbi:MAG: hypothetical protein AAF517_22580, partial [Planctomycetota bacterium]
AAEREREIARPRLFLGITCVGTIVSLSTVALAFELPQNWRIDTGSPWIVDALTIATFLTIFAALSAPFDWIGRRLVPNLGTQPRTKSWLRAVVFQTVVYFSFAMVLLLSGAMLGHIGTLAVFVLLNVGLAHFQTSIFGILTGAKHRVLGAFGPARPKARYEVPIRVIETTDNGFTGGTTGLPGREQVLLPSRWRTQLSAQSRVALLERFQSIVRSGSHRRGLSCAIAWNVVGFSAASYLPGAGFESGAALVTTILWFTLWSFLGLLLLPTVSRIAVRSADRVAIRDGSSAKTLSQAIEELREITRGEAQRSAGVESIFHPVPSPGRRPIREAAETNERAPWHVARTALFLSWAGLGLLSRAVHCNCGRPELWAFLPNE